MKKQNRMTALTAAWVLVLILGSAGMAAASDVGYTDRDMAFFSWSDRVGKEVYDEYQTLMYSSIDIVPTYFFYRIERIAQRKIWELDIYSVSSNVETAKNEFKFFLIGMRDFGTHGAEYAVTRKDSDKLNRDGSVLLAEECLEKYFEEMQRIISEGLNEGDDSFIYITPSDAIDISVNLPGMKDFLARADDLASVDVYFQKRYLNREMWLVAWTLDKLHHPAPERMYIYIDVRTGEVVNYDGIPSAKELKLP